MSSGSHDPHLPAAGDLAAAAAGVGAGAELDDEATVVVPSKAQRDLDEDVTIVVPARPLAGAESGGGTGAGAGAGAEVGADVADDTGTDTGDDATVVVPLRQAVEADDEATVVAPLRQASEVDDDATVVRPVVPRSVPERSEAERSEGPRSEGPRPAPERTRSGTSRSRGSRRPLGPPPGPVPEPVLERPALREIGEVSRVYGARPVATADTEGLDAVHQSLGPAPEQSELAAAADLVDLADPAAEGTSPDRSELPSLARRFARVRLITLIGFAAALAVSVGGLWVIGRIAWG